MSDDPSYVPNPQVVVTLLEGESVLLDLASRRYYSLNETGTRIWSLVSEGFATSRIVSAVTTEYDVTETEAADHVETLLSQLLSEGLISESSDRDT